MIATIVCGIIIVIMFVFVLTYSIKKRLLDKFLLGISSVIFVVCVFTCVSTLLVGYNFKPNLQEKEMLEILLERDPSLYVIEKAQKYNDDVMFSNNLWFRFTIEDRSEYLIDINSYLKE